MKTKFKNRLKKPTNKTSPYPPPNKKRKKKQQTTTNKQKQN